MIPASYKYRLLWNSTRALSAGLVLVLMCSSALSQQQLIQFSSQQSTQLAAPAGAIHSEAIRVNPEILEAVSAGGSVLVQIDPIQMAEVSVDKLTQYVNGDLGVSARGLREHSDLSFTLTIGASRLFGYIATSRSLWQITAVKEGEDFVGWVYQPESLKPNSGSLAHDFIIPDRVTPNIEKQPNGLTEIQALPLLLGPASFNDQPMNATTADISQDNFTVQQSFNPSPVVTGGNTNAQITLSNSSSEVHSDLYLEVYFLLEDTDLVSADASCSESLSASLQTILRCSIGDFQPGEQKILNFSVQTQLGVTNPLFSTILIGDLRSDAVINVVEDVRIDSDADGLSDFNEELIGTDPVDPASNDFSPSVIDVLALFSDGASAAYPLGVQTRINQLISVANQIYRDSGVAITLRPVHHLKVDYDDAVDMDIALNDLMNLSRAENSNLDELRDTYGADLVIFFRLLEGDNGRCGLAPVGGFQTNGFMDPVAEKQNSVSTVAIDCPLDIAVAHELGHNMGLTHSHIEDGYGGTFSFSTGYGVEGQFVTVMAYPGAFGNANRISRFSNPAATCFGLSCGVDANSELGADAVQALNIVRHQIANYRPTVVPDLPATSVKSLNGTTSAVISIAASRDEGLSFSTEFSPDDKVDMSVVIQVDERHIGSEGSLHVLVGQRGRGQFYQPDENGQLSVWDGSLDGLIPLDDVRVLNSEERLALLNGFRFGNELIGMDLVVYVGYRVFDTDDFVYTDSPFTLKIIQ